MIDWVFIGGLILGWVGCTYALEVFERNRDKWQ
jgi:hypothetical protein